jgi:selenium-binding protein 1
LKLDKAVQLPVVEVEGWLSESMPAMITDLVISLDDRFMYVSCWLHGFIAQYDITDPFRITLKAKA